MFQPGATFFPQQLARMLTLCGVLEFRQLLIATTDNHAHPLRLICDFINLYTDLRISSHPLNLLPERGEDIDAIRLICKANRHDVWLIIQRAHKPSEPGTFQKVVALKEELGEDRPERIFFARSLPLFLARFGTSPGCRPLSELFWFIACAR